MRAIISFLFIFLCGFSAFNSTKINFYGVNIEEKKMDEYMHDIHYSIESYLKDNESYWEDGKRLDTSVFPIRFSRFFFDDSPWEMEIFIPYHYFRISDSLICPVILSQTKIGSDNVHLLLWGIVYNHVEGKFLSKPFDLAYEVGNAFRRRYFFSSVSLNNRKNEIIVSSDKYDITMDLERRARRSFENQADILTRVSWETGEIITDVDEK